MSLINKSIEESTKDIENYYRQIERNFDCSNYDNGSLSDLSDGSRNQDKPIHSWYNLKESFSSDFPPWVVNFLNKEYNFKVRHVLDPFVGGGTTPLSLLASGIEIHGVEYNPFIAWVSKIKTSWPDLDMDEIGSSLRRLRFNVPKGFELDWPRLTTFNNANYFRKSDVETLLFILYQINKLDISSLTKQFLRLCVASIIEEVSNLRKDGRALRYIGETNRCGVRYSFVRRFRSNLKGLVEEFRQLDSNSFGKSFSWEGSATDLKNICNPLNAKERYSFPPAFFDLVLFSPPYLNNFDYSEIYKLELWLLGFIKSYEQWRQLRLGTIRSHHSLKFQSTSFLEEDPIMAEISDFINSIGKSPLLTSYSLENMPAVIRGYFDDMFLVIKEQARVLKPGGFLVYMVANSRHSDLPIATDLLLSEIARLSGFTPLKLLVLKKRNGRTRQKLFLRESIIIMRKNL